MATATKTRRPKTDRPAMSAREAQSFSIIDEEAGTVTCEVCEEPAKCGLCNYTIDAQGNCQRTAERAGRCQ